MDATADRPSRPKPWRPPAARRPERSLFAERFAGKLVGACRKSKTRRAGPLFGALRRRDRIGGDLAAIVRLSVRTFARDRRHIRIEPLLLRTGRRRAAGEKHRVEQRLGAQLHGFLGKKRSRPPQGRKFSRLDLRAVAIAAKEKIGFGEGEFAEPVGGTVIRRHGPVRRKVFVTLGKRDETADGRLRALVGLGRGRRGNAGRGAINRAVGLFLLQSPPVLDVARMLVERFGEDMTARAVGDKIEIARRRRMRGGFKRGAAGIGDRSRRKAVDGVGVVRRPLLDLGCA